MYSKCDLSIFEINKENVFHFGEISYGDRQ